MTCFDERIASVLVLEDLHMKSDSTMKSPSSLAFVIFLASSSEGGGTDTPNHAVVIVLASNSCEASRSTRSSK